MVVGFGRPVSRFGRLALASVALVAPAIAMPSVARAQADLVVTSFSTTPSDRSVDYKATVCNNGTSTSTFWGLAFYKRTTTAPTCSTSASSSVGYYGLQAGKCVTRTWSDTSVPVGSGTGWVLADNGCKITETNESNNIKSSTYTIAKPDLYINSFTATVNDRDVSFSSQICNKGTTAVTYFGTGLYNARSTAPTCSATPNPDSHVGHYSLKANSCLTHNGTFSNAPVGAGTGWVLADTRCSVAEADETNNAKSAAYTVAKPDLYIKSFSATWVGGDVKLSAQVCNRGTTAIKYHALKLLSTATSTTPCAFAGTSVGGYGAYKHAAGTCKTLSATISKPAPGRYRSWAIADSGCVVPDANRADNAKYVDWGSGLADGGSVAMDGAVGDGPPDAATSRDGGTYVPDRGLIGDAARPPPDGGPGDGGTTTSDAARPWDATTCVDGSSCTCLTSKTIGVSATLAGGFSAETRCPVVGNTGSVGAEVNGTISGEATGCPTCKASLKAEAKLKATIGLCKNLEFEAEGSGSYSTDRKFCLQCDRKTCQQSCNPNKSCTEKSYSGSAKLSVSRALGYRFRKKYGQLSLTAKCGVKVTGSISGKASLSETDDGGCAPCQQCEKTSAEVTGGVKGSGGCYARLRYHRFKKTVGCRNCSELSLDIGGGSSRQKGKCTTKGCKWAKITAAGQFKTPSACFGVWWFKVGASCQAEAKGECVADTCKGSSCKPSAKLTCNVKAGYSACD